MDTEEADKVCTILKEEFGLENLSSLPTLVGNNYYLPG
jgi:hypothetical protein